MMKLLVDSNAPKPLVAFDSYQSAYNFLRMHLLPSINEMDYRVFSFIKDRAYGIVKVYLETDEGPTGLMPQHKVNEDECLDLETIQDAYRNTHRRKQPLSLEGLDYKEVYRKLPFIRHTDEELAEMREQQQRFKPNWVYETTTLP